MYLDIKKKKKRKVKKKNRKQFYTNFEVVLFYREVHGM